jgi:hypothetical protein
LARRSEASSSTRRKRDELWRGSGAADGGGGRHAGHGEVDRRGAAGGVARGHLAAEREHEQAGDRQVELGGRALGAAAERGELEVHHAVAERGAAVADREQQLAGGVVARHGADGEADITARRAAEREVAEQREDLADLDVAPVEHGRRLGVDPVADLGAHAGGVGGDRLDDLAHERGRVEHAGVVGGAAGAAEREQVEDDALELLVVLEHELGHRHEVGARRGLDERAAGLAQHGQRVLELERQQGHEVVVGVQHLLGDLHGVVELALALTLLADVFDDADDVALRGDQADGDREGCRRRGDAAPDRRGTAGRRWCSSGCCCAGARGRGSGRSACRRARWPGSSRARTACD